MSNEELKPCPFCGGKANLRRIRAGYRTNPTAILDEWQVECPNGCCHAKTFSDEIYHDESGEIVIKRDGAKDAVNAWNRRT